MTPVWLTRKIRIRYYHGETDTAGHSALIGLKIFQLSIFGLGFRENLCRMVNEMSMEFVRDDSLDAQSVRQIVENAGITKRAADVLVQVIMEQDFLGRALGRTRDFGNDLDFVRRFVTGAVECFRFENPDAGLLDLMLVLSGYRKSDWWAGLIPPDRLKKWNEAAIGPLARASWAKKLLAGMGPIAPAFVDVWTPEATKSLIEFAGLLSDRLGVESLNIPAAIDVSLTLEGLHHTGSDAQAAPATPLFWYLAFNQRGIIRFDGREPQSNTLTSQILDLADSMGVDDMAALYLAVVDALIVCTRRSPIQDPMTNVMLGLLTGGNHLPMLSTRKIVLDHLPSLTDRALSAPDNRIAQIAWLKTGAWVATRLPSSPALADRSDVANGTLTIDSPDRFGECAATLLEHADRIVGTSRKDIREGRPIDWPAVEYSVKLLSWLGSPWRALRAVTLMLMLAPEACTGPDLRWWSDKERAAPPMPWSQIPQWYSWLILWSDVHAEHDPDFKRGREDFSQFLLERLRDCLENEKAPELKGTRVPAESRPEWRLAICEAAIALHVNPKGRGDHLLYQVMNHDPDERVREAAGRAYSKVRHYNKGDTGGVSARNLFMKSFWWLRQAQRLSLGLDIDRAGAQRTMNKELDRNEVNQWV